MPNFIAQALIRVQRFFSQPDRYSAKTYLQIYGAGTIFIYLIFSWYFQNHFQIWSRASRNLSNVVLIPGIVLLLYFYYRGYRLLEKYPDAGFKVVVGFGLLAALAAVSIPSFYSFDVNMYVNYGWQQARYHANPYCLLVAGTEGFGTDPMFTDTWTLNPLPYGFAFGHLTRMVCELSGSDLQRAIFIFKATNFAAWCALGGLVYKGALKLKLSRPDLCLYLYMWSPIILMQSLSGCHNDILMTLPVMAAFFCACFAEAGVACLALPLMTLGVLIKYLWILSLPFFLLFLLKKHGWTFIAVSVIASMLLVVCLGWYYRCDISTVRWTEFNYNLTTNANSLAAVIQSVGRSLELIVARHNSPEFEGGIKFVCTIVKGFTGILFASTAVAEVLKFWRNRFSNTMLDVLSSSLTLVMIYTCFVSSKFYPWYIVMFFPVSLWLPKGNKVRSLALIFSCTQVLAVTFLGHGHLNNFLLLTALPLFFWYRANFSGQVKHTRALDS